MSNLKDFIRYFLAWFFILLGIALVFALVVIGASLLIVVCR